ncbi:putative MFS transporter [Aspergillus pseudoustus]|uniref:MFS transporter n=1 Tax=Aspergillus pseudoustus TaxID=1810923 RepID=A0ABR4L1C8_9EURO
MQEKSEKDLETQATEANASPASLSAGATTRETIGRILSTNFAYFMGGLNDAALGVLIPYIQPSYNVNLLQVSLIYLINFAGWMTASFTNIHICSLIGTGGTLVFGAIVQCIGYALICWASPFPLFVAAFYFTGCGVGLQDAQANIFTLSLPKPHRWLGILHAIYGVGTVVAPLIANALASSTSYWYRYYLITLGLGVVNTVLLAWTWKRGLFRPNVHNARDTAGSELRATLSSGTVWLFNMFFFLYVGAEVTSGGWLVQFLVSVRNGDPEKVGYIASAYWGGLTLGRVTLADITHRFGEKRMIFIYIVLAIALQLMFWLIPHIITDAIMICLLGYFIGPFYPVGLYVLTETVPQNVQNGAVGFAASVGQGGSAAFPFLTGSIASRAGVIVLQPVMISLLVGIAFLWGLIHRQSVTQAGCRVLTFMFKKGE